MNVSDHVEDEHGDGLMTGAAVHCQRQSNWHWTRSGKEH